MSAKYPISKSKATDVEISRGQACVETKQKENHWVSWEWSFEGTKARVRKSAKKKKGEKTKQALWWQQTRPRRRKLTLCPIQEKHLSAQGTYSVLGPSLSNHSRKVRCCLCPPADHCSTQPQECWFLMRPSPLTPSAGACQPCRWKPLHAPSASSALESQKNGPILNWTQIWSRWRTIVSPHLSVLLQFHRFARLILVKVGGLSADMCAEKYKIQPNWFASPGWINQNSRVNLVPCVNRWRLT